MRHYVFLFLLLAGISCLIFSACTPPPEESPDQDDPNGVEEVDDTLGADALEDANGEEPIEAEGTSPKGNPDDGPGNDEDSGDVDAEDEVEIIEPETETEEEETMTETNEIPENIFGHYEEWPPEAITDEEVELLTSIRVVFETTKGIIKIQLFPNEAPIHGANCVKLVQDGFYDGLIFHRVISNFMSQGGDPDGTGGGGPGYTLPAEIELPHLAGSMSAARTGDQINPERRSSGSQFYFVHTDQSGVSLNGMYTVYGRIVEGLDVNLSLSVNYTGAGPIPGAETDNIIKAWVEMG